MSHRDSFSARKYPFISAGSNKRSEKSIRFFRHRFAVVCFVDLFFEIEFIHRSFCEHVCREFNV